MGRALDRLTSRLADRRRSRDRLGRRTVRRAADAAGAGRLLGREPEEHRSYFADLVTGPRTAWSVPTTLEAAVTTTNGFMVTDIAIFRPQDSGTEVLEVELLEGASPKARLAAGIMNSGAARVGSNTLHLRSGVPIGASQALNVRARVNGNTASNGQPFSVTVSGYLY